MPSYLTDSSIWIGSRRWSDTYLPGLLAERIGAGEVATCVPTTLEVLVGAASAVEIEQDWEAVWEHVRWLPVSAATMERALDLLLGLGKTTRGAHRRRPIDFIVAACAETAGEDVVLWHWDRDLAAICDFAGIAHEPEHERAKANGINVEPGGRPA